MNYVIAYTCSEDITFAYINCVFRIISHTAVLLLPQYG